MSGDCYHCHNGPAHPSWSYCPWCGLSRAPATAPPPKHAVDWRHLYAMKEVKPQRERAEVLP